jgi:probable phosphoglycerate mutase
MIMQKDFYFVRHGQTDHNILEGQQKGDHAGDVPLNEAGKGQAKAIEPLIRLLPIRTICSSPMKRAKETKDIIASRLQVPHFEIDDLGECSAWIWKEMKRLRIQSLPPTSGDVGLFIDRVRNGINHVLSLPGPPLIVAHGGIHWAICYLMSIEKHEWAIDNCAVVHFSIDENGKWIALKLA